MDGPRVIAHRGSHGGFGGGRSENTLTAFEHAVALGADMIELDVRRTRDGRLVVFHDARSRGRPLTDLNWEELCARSMRDVPLLEEILEWALVHQVALDVELKEGGYAEEVVRRLSAFVARGGALLVTSFIDGVIGSVRRLAPELPCGLLLWRRSRGACARAHRCGASTLVVPMALVSGGLFDATDAAGLRCLAWDYLPERHARRRLDARLWGVITDDVAGARVALADSAVHALRG